MTELVCIQYLFYGKSLTILTNVMASSQILSKKDEDQSIKEKIGFYL